MNRSQTDNQVLNIGRTTTEQYQSADDLAGFLQVHPKTLLRMAREGKIPAHPFGEWPAQALEISSLRGGRLDALESKVL